MRSLERKIGGVCRAVAVQVHGTRGQPIRRIYDFRRYLFRKLLEILWKIFGSVGVRCSGS